MICWYSWYILICWFDVIWRFLHVHVFWPHCNHQLVVFFFILIWLKPSTAMPSSCLYIIFSGCPSLSSPAWLTGIPIMDSASPSASWSTGQAVAIRPSGFPDQVSPKFCWLGLHLSPQLGSHLCWDDEEGLCWPWDKSLARSPAPRLLKTHRGKTHSHGGLHSRTILCQDLLMNLMPRHGSNVGLLYTFVVDVFQALVAWQHFFRTKQGML